MEMGCGSLESCVAAGAWEDGAYLRHLHLCRLRDLTPIFPLEHGKMVLISHPSIRPRQRKTSDVTPPFHLAGKNSPVSPFHHHPCCLHDSWIASFPLSHLSCLLCLPFTAPRRRPSFTHPLARPSFIEYLSEPISHPSTISCACWIPLHHDSTDISPSHQIKKEHIFL